jgi:hypothetical protein
MSLATVADEPLSKDTLLAKAVEAWKQSSAQLDGMCITWKEIRHEIRAVEKKDEINTYRYVLNTQGDMFSLQTIAVGSPKTGSFIVVQNDDYAFEVGQEMKEDEWYIEYYGSPDNNAIQSPKDNEIAVLKTPWAIFSVPMWDIVNDPSFMIQGLKYQKGETKDDVFLKFSLNSTGEGNIGEIKGGEILFAPDRYWIIKEYSLNLKHKNEPGTFQIKVKASYNDADGIPLMTRQEYTLLIPSGQITWTSEIESREKSVLTAADFRLTAFGLPEPKADSWSTARILLAVSGLILIAVALWIMFSKHKTAS